MIKSIKISICGHDLDVCYNKLAEEMNNCELSDKQIINIDIIKHEPVYTCMIDAYILYK